MISFSSWSNPSHFYVCKCVCHSNDLCWTRLNGFDVSFPFFLMWHHLATQQCFSVGHHLLLAVWHILNRGLSRIHQVPITPENSVYFSCHLALPPHLQCSKSYDGKCCSVWVDLGAGHGVGSVHLRRHKCFKWWVKLSELHLWFTVAVS